MRSFGRSYASLLGSHNIHWKKPDQYPACQPAGHSLPPIGKRSAPFMLLRSGKR